MPEFGDQSTDWAILLDGESKQTNSKFKVEYGIIGQGEVETRLNRQAGRMGNGIESAIAESRNLLAGQAPLPERTDLFEIPGCGLFLDWHWHYARKLPTEGFAVVVAEMLEEAQEESWMKSLGVLKRLGFDAVGSQLAEAE
jgi:hypothetical protein